DIENADDSTHQGEEGFGGDLSYGEFTLGAETSNRTGVPQGDTSSVEKFRRVLDRIRRRFRNA
ncbi:hypothetical protein H1215_21020, partial [Anoxybacillus sp. LAT_38]|nr:hypothetical protein [Anoxybacillus sp. LAT_38]